MTQLTIQQAFDLARQRHQAGNLREAELIYRQILAQQPEHADALLYLGLIAHRMGQGEIALELIRRAVARMPGNADAHFSLGMALNGKRQFDEATAAYRQAIALRPNFAEAHYNLGNSLKKMGQRDEAIASFRQAIAYKPDYVDAHIALGNGLHEKRQFGDAIAAYRQAIAVRPIYAEAFNNLGVALKENGQLDDAIDAWRHSVGLKPDYAEAYYNLGSAMKDKGQLEDAVAAYRQAVAHMPDFVPAHWYLSLCLLTSGDLAAGWEEFDWRLKFAPLGLDRGFPQPLWDGADLAGKTLLVHAEGGFGDALHFSRYIPLLRQTGAAKANILIECQTQLAPLLRELSGADRIICRGDPLPNFDYQIPFQSLPRIFHTDLKNVPNSVPYLRVPADRRSRRTGRQPRDGKRNVGLCWAGSHNMGSFVDPRTRKLEYFAPLARVANVRFVSLQTGPEAAQHRPPGLEVLDFSADLRDFADAAALLEGLDLVVGVDTSVAHLAGALAKPVWVLIPFVADFRWMRDRTDSPWYPTMRLFRQKSLGDWDSVIARLAHELSLWIERHR